LDFIATEILTHIISLIDDPDELWKLRRVSKKWKYIIHHLLHAKVKAQFVNSPNSFALLVCQITPKTMSYSDAIRVRVKGFDNETGLIICECATSAAINAIKVGKRAKSSGKGALIRM